MKTFIYILNDPITNDVRYVGKSNNPKSRLSHHILKAKSNKHTHLKKWISKLLAINLKPILNIIEIVDIEIWQKREIYWIKYFKDKGCNLCNHTSGGEGLSNCSESTKQKIRENNKRNIDKYRTPEFRLKISNLSKNLIRTPEHCKRIGESKIGKKRDPEITYKMGLANLKPIIIMNRNGKILNRYEGVNYGADKLGIDQKWFINRIKNKKVIKKLKLIVVYEQEYYKGIHEKFN